MGGGDLSTDSFSGGRNDPYFMGARLVKPTRGFGFWCWKPQIILQSLRQINDGDMLIYADLGCEFSAKGAKNLLAKLKDLESSDMIGFSLGTIEKEYTKGDVFRHFGVENDARFTQSRQIIGTIIFMKKSQKTLQIIDEWLNIFRNHFDLVDDSPSKSPNLQGFIQNRHDQSIWSLLNKKYNLTNFDYAVSAECGILISRKTRNALGLFFDTNGRFKPFKKIKFKILHGLFKFGAKILPKSYAKEQCNLWLKYTRV